MSKAGVEKAEKLLANPQVSMVIVRLTIPIGVSPKDRLDVQVEVPAACGTKSLAGGYLLTTRLREVLLAGGSPKESFDMALAQGPVMIGTPAKPNDPKVGRVLGGGKGQERLSVHSRHQGKPRELSHLQDAGKGRQRTLSRV